MHISKTFLASLIVIMVMVGVVYKPSSKKQAQEATAEDTLMIQEAEADEMKTFEVTHKVSNPAHESVADILWMKKVADIAIERGMANFNVLYQNVERTYDARLKREVTVVDGTIELTNDPMEGEFNANEIRSLVLPEIVDN
jgi:hypothetical protein